MLFFRFVVLLGHEGDESRKLFIGRLFVLLSLPLPEWAVA
jgi:hypothetical protein